MSQGDKALLKTLNHLEYIYAERVLEDISTENLEYLYINYVDLKYSYDKALRYISNELDRRKENIEEFDLT